MAYKCRMTTPAPILPEHTPQYITDVAETVSNSCLRRISVLMT